MKAIMWTDSILWRQDRLKSALSAATGPIRDIAKYCCAWEGENFVFDGTPEDYQKLYFWFCGYGDAMAAQAEALLPKANP